MNDSLISSLLLFKKSFYSLVNSQCQKYNLTSAELFLLGILYKNGDMHQIEIARNMDCDKAHIHRITCKLAQKGFIEFVDCHHGKNQTVHLKDLGQKITKSFDGVIASVMEIIYKDVKDEDIALTAKTIEKFAKNILDYKEKEKNNV